MVTAFPDLDSLEVGVFPDLDNLAVCVGVRGDIRHSPRGRYSSLLLHCWRVLWEEELRHNQGIHAVFPHTGNTGRAHIRWAGL